MTDADAPTRLAATLEQLEDDTAVLDVEGHALRVPRAWLPGTVREGDGFEITVRPAPETRAKLEASVAARLQRLQGGGGGGEGDGSGSERA